MIQSGGESVGSVLYLGIVLSTESRFCAGLRRSSFVVRRSSFVVRRSSLLSS